MAGFHAIIIAAQLRSGEQYENLCSWYGQGGSHLTLDWPVAGPERRVVKAEVEVKGTFYLSTQKGFMNSSD